VGCGRGAVADPPRLRRGLRNTITWKTDDCWCTCQYYVAWAMQMP
jgi:hypothetical protein